MALLTILLLVLLLLLGFLIGGTLMVIEKTNIRLLVSVKLCFGRLKCVSKCFAGLKHSRCPTPSDMVSQLKSQKSSSDLSRTLPQLPPHSGVLRFHIAEV